MSIRDVFTAARGRWRSILTQLGVSAEALRDKHGPCPMCGGKDRFRFDDKNGGGSFICGQCGAGNGLDLVMRFTGKPYAEAKEAVLQLLPGSSFAAPKPIVADLAKRAVDAWKAAKPLSGIDAASKYLAKRGFSFEKYPTELRFERLASHYAKNGQRTIRPALIARFVSPDAAAWTIQTTYLTDAGDKAFKGDGSRKLAPGRVPPGGAVRLAHSAETMGIAEGVETALAASKLFDVPVWAALTAGALTKWKPPATVKHILIFADADKSFTGQAAAYALAHRLCRERKSTEVFLPPDTAKPELGVDWNDVLTGGKQDG